MWPGKPFNPSRNEASPLRQPGRSGGPGNKSNPCRLRTSGVAGTDICSPRGLPCLAGALPVFPELMMPTKETHELRTFLPHCLRETSSENDSVVMRRSPDPGLMGASAACCNLAASGSMSLLSSPPPMCFQRLLGGLRGAVRSSSMLSSLRRGSWPAGQRAQRTGPTFPVLPLLGEGLPSLWEPQALGEAPHLDCWLSPGPLF